MKKHVKSILTVLLVLTMVFALCACTVPEVQIQNEDGTLTIWGVLIEQSVNIVYRLLWAATLAFGAWVLDKIGKNVKLKNLSIAIQRVCDTTRQTAEELKQTIVDDLKKSRPGGKLTLDDVYDLRFRLLKLVKTKLDTETQEIVTASGADLDALITGECEAFLSRLKAYSIPVPTPATEPGEEKEQDDE